MKLIRLLPAALVALCSVTLLAEQPPSPSPSPSAKPQVTGDSPLPSPAPAPDAAVLTKLLRDFLAGASRNDPAIHDRFWADDLIYTGSIGRRLGKAQLMREVRAEAAAPASPSAETATYTADDIRIQQYGDTAIVAFRLVAATKKGDQTETANYLNTGTFLKRRGEWKVVAWQATKLPPKTTR